MPPPGAQAKAHRSPYLRGFHDMHLRCHQRKVNSAPGCRGRAELLPGLVEPGTSPGMYQSRQWVQASVHTETFQHTHEQPHTEPARHTAHGTRRGARLWPRPPSPSCRFPLPLLLSLDPCRFRACPLSWFPSLSPSDSPSVLPQSLWVAPSLALRVSPFFQLFLVCITPYLSDRVSFSFRFSESSVLLLLSLCPHLSPYLSDSLSVSRSV